MRLPSWGRSPFAAATAAWTFGVLVLLGLLAAKAVAHDFGVGGIRIDHPYAIPTRPGMSTGVVYFRSISNMGNEPDRLLSARTPAAATVELRRTEVSADQGHMHNEFAIELPPKTEVRLRHNTAKGQYLLLHGLKTPLKDGDRFPVVLTFLRAGEREVMVWVQTPLDGVSPVPHH